MVRRRLRACAMGVLVVAGCATAPAAPPGGGGGPAAAPVPSPTPSPVRVLDFDDRPLGALDPMDPDWVDVQAEGLAAGRGVPQWLYRGAWEIAPASEALHGRMLRQTKVQERPPITLLRYRGPFYDATDGQMPAHYRMEIAQQPVRSPYNLPPTGDQGVQVYYRDLNHYVEVVTTPQELQLWACNGGVPDSASGWEKLWSRPLATQPMDVRRIGAIVDVGARRVQVLYNGQVEAEQSGLAVMNPAAAAGVALRAIGNEVNFDDVRLERLP